VIEQVRHVSQTSIVRNAWQRGQALSLHGWIYDVRDGLLHDLGCKMSSEDNAGSYAEAVARVAAGTGRRA